MKKLLALAMALLLCVGAASAMAEADLITVGYAQVGHESDWRLANTLDYQTTFVPENGYDLTFVDADNDHAYQIETVRTFIQNDLDYIVIAPVQSAGWETVLGEAQEAGIPVFNVDRAFDCDPSLYTAQIITDMVFEGENAGRWLEEYLAGKEAKILVIEGSVGASATIGRSEGFNNIAKNHPEWEILDVQSGDFTQAGGQEVMESYLKSYPEFDVVICQNDNEAYGAMDAMDAAGVTYGVNGKVILMSYDATNAGLTYTLEGKINFNQECNPMQAATNAEVIQKIENGEAFDKVIVVPDQAFVAPGIESAIATTITQEIIDSRPF
ncbi:MAG: ABC transporter substrate-binding protein [Oscillospiraceae bacterium]|jgi:simple sugar transport system substrate-binding protein|nr:ABC transporter substrate-binding protein [Oscillospiraceae bacterium]